MGSCYLFNFNTNLKRKQNAFQEKAEAKRNAEGKKTDAFTADDQPIPAKTKSQLDIPEENAEEDEDGGGEEEEEEGAEEASQDEEEPEKSESGQGDVPSSLKKRKPLKE